MNKDKDFLGTEPVGKLMFRLALPTITAQLINMLYNIIDRIYIGHIPGNGALALTGVGVCMPLIMIISAFAALVGGGGAPHASIAMGKNDLNTAEHILGNCSPDSLPMIREDPRAVFKYTSPGVPFTTSPIISALLPFGSFLLFNALLIFS